MRSAFVLAGCLLLALATPADACRPRTSVNDVEDEVMCLVCGVPLSLSTESPQAQRERALIARLAAACWSKQRIKRELVVQYGPAVLADTPGSGFGVSAWLVPLGGVAALGGGLAAATLARRRHDPRARADES